VGHAHSPATRLALTAAAEDNDNDGVTDNVEVVLVVVDTMALSPCCGAELASCCPNVSFAPFVDGGLVHVYRRGWYVD
jgi:hypothetical protein